MNGEQTGGLFFDNDTTFSELLNFFQSQLCENNDLLNTEAKVSHGAEGGSGGDRKAPRKAKVNHGAEGGPGGDRKAPRIERRPGCSALKAEQPCIARMTMPGCSCEVFQNGYAIYDNGDRRTVLRVADCGTLDYSFTPLKPEERTYQSQSARVGQDVLGSQPWYMPLMLAGEARIERNLDQACASEHAGGGWMPEGGIVEGQSVWSSGARPENPEELCLRREEEAYLRQQVLALRPKQREAVRLCCLESLPVREAARRLRIEESAVSERLRSGRRALREKMLQFYDEPEREAVEKSDK